MKRVLLIVDDWPGMAQALRRYLQRDFAVIHIAQSPQQAEALLDRPNGPTHVLCDYYFGEDQPLGTQLAKRWRQQFPGVERVALMTASDLPTGTLPAEVDAIFVKPIDLKALRDFLLGRNATENPSPSP